MNVAFDFRQMLPTRSRTGFTIAEALMAMAVLTGALLLVGELAVQSLRESARGAAHQEAIELAGNILELARATPFDALTPEWAAARQMPQSSAEHFVEGRMSVKVEAEPGQPRLKRVTVEVGWLQPEGQRSKQVRLVTLIRSRTSVGVGGKS